MTPLSLLLALLVTTLQATVKNKKSLAKEEKILLEARDLINVALAQIHSKHRAR